MRITSQEAVAIRRVTTELAGSRAKVSLIGSRTRDDLRCCDIDLLIELPDVTEDKLALPVRGGARLQLAIDERSIDVLVTAPLSEETARIRAARSQGIELRRQQAGHHALQAKPRAELHVRSLAPRGFLTWPQAAHRTKKGCPSTGSLLRLSTRPPKPDRLGRMDGQNR